MAVHLIEQGGSLTPRRQLAMYLANYRPMSVDDFDALITQPAPVVLSWVEKMTWKPEKPTFDTIKKPTLVTGLALVEVEFFGFGIVKPKCVIAYNDSVYKQCEFNSGDVLLMTERETICFGQVIGETDGEEYFPFDGPRDWTPDGDDDNDGIGGLFKGM